MSKPTDQRWLITSTGSDYESLMGFYEGCDREKAIREFTRQHFSAGGTFVLKVHRVDAGERVQGTYEMNLKLVPF